MAEVLYWQMVSKRWLRSGRNSASYAKHLTAAGGNDGAVTPTEYAVRPRFGYRTLKSKYERDTMKRAEALYR